MGQRGEDGLSLAVSAGVTGQAMVASLDDELSLVVMDYVDGATALRAAAASREWGRLLLGASSDDYWRRTTIRELDAPALRDCSPPLCSAATWRARYRELRQRCPKKARWLSWSTRHGLTDRVAAPQLFVGPRGRRLFCYGGWTRLGPQTDVQWTNLSEIAKLARRGRGRSSEAGVQHAMGPNFQRAVDTGRPVQRGGVQTLTPLWRTNGGLEGPSRRHVAATLGVPVPELESDVELVMAFGGGGGGYNNEHNDWRIAALKEGRDEEPVRIAWTDVGRSVGSTHDDQADIDTRCAHSATYVPPRLLDGHAEGAVFVIGGHTDDCSRSLAAVDCLDVAQWTWERHIGEGCSFIGRHGHSATLVEVNGAGYIVVVGGGTGNILHGFGAGIAEFDDCCVFDCRAKHWVASFDLGARQTVGTCFGRHHTSAACCNGRALLFGGGSSPTNRLGLLDMTRCVKRALSTGSDLPACRRRRVEEPLLSDLTPQLVQSEVPTAPRGRKMHGAACLLPWLPLFVVFGGWEFGPHFSDMWLADLEPAGGSSIADVEQEKGPENDDDDQSLDDQYYEHCTGVEEDDVPIERDDDAYDQDDEYDGDEEDDGDDEDLVALNLATDTGMHQIQIPRSVFHRLVRQGMLGFAPNNPNQHVLDANGSPS